MDVSARQRIMASIAATLSIPPDVTLRTWDEGDFPRVQQLSAAEGWTTPTERAPEALAAWHRSWPALVALHGEDVIGFCRALSDGTVTTYIAELLVATSWRGQGIATALLQTTHHLCPGTRLDLLATGASMPFYERLEYRPFAGFRWSWQEECARS